MQRATDVTTLTSLAILKVDIDENEREYLDYLATFVVEALAKHRPEVVSAVDVSGLLNQEFGLHVPIQTVKLVLRRLASRTNYFELREGAYFLSATFPSPSMQAKREGARIHIDSVVHRLCTFSEEIGLETPWKPEDATRATLSFLSQFAVDCLRTFVFNTALPKIPDTGKVDHYIVGRFVTEAYNSDKALFNSFIVLVKGQMYANALTCPDLDSLTKKFSTLTIYLDTPIILNLLGLHGQEYEKVSKELVELVRDLRGSVRVFSHTIEETTSVIQFSINNYDNARVSNRLLREIRDSNMQKSELILINGRLDKLLGEMHIRIDETPPYSSTYQIDESAFQDAIKEEVQYLGQQALRHDVNSVRSIYVRRQGKTPSRLEDAVAIFVTNNTAFAKAAYKQGRNHNSSREVSPVITDFSLSNIAWLKAPMKKPELPEREALAMCYAAMEPSASLLEKYLKSMDEMMRGREISEEDHALLRASSIAQTELMNLTLGDDGALSKTSISTILERAKASLIADITEQHRGTLTQVERRQTELEAEIDRLNGNLRDRGSEADYYRGQFKRIANVLADGVVWAPFVLVSLALFVGAIYGAGLVPLPVKSSHPVAYWACISFIVLAVCAGWYSLLTGKALVHSRKMMKDKLALSIERLLSGSSDA